MAKSIIGALVGAVLIFLWQFLSWGPMNLHADALKYTDKQDSILNYLGTQLSEDGQYSLPNVPKTASADERQKLSETMQGKPYAMINYIKSFNENMNSNMIRGFFVNVFIVFFFIWIVRKFSASSFSSILFSALAVGFIGWLFTPYTNHIWFKTPWAGVQAELVDAIVAWGLCGVWLGWWLNRGK